MKKTSFVLGLIGGILGILICIALIGVGFASKVTNPFGGTAILFGFIGAVFSIIGLVGACLNNKILLLIAFVLNIITAFNLISNSPSGLYFGIEIIVSILFLIATIFAFINKKSIQGC